MTDEKSADERPSITTLKEGERAPFVSCYFSSVLLVAC